MDVRSVKSRFTKRQKDLLKVVESGNLARFQNLLSMRLHNRSIDKETFSYLLLVTALHRGDTSISKYLIEKDCQVRIASETKSYCTPLHYAVRLDDVDLCRELCVKGASIHDKDANQESALELAMVKGNDKAVQCFLTHYLNQANLSLDPRNENDVALFHAVCWYNRSSLASIENLGEMFIVNFGFSTSQPSNFMNEEWRGFTALHFVLMAEARSFSQFLLKSLLKHDNTGVFTKDEKGRTPLNIAFRSKNLEFLNIFVEHTCVQGIHNPVDKYGLSHLHIFCCLKFSKIFSEKTLFQTQYLEHLKNLIDIGDINSSVSFEDQDYPGYTALHFAVKHLQIHVVKLLLEKGADPSKSNKYGETPLHYILPKYPQVLDEEEFEIISLLLEYGANVDIQDVKGCTPLHKVFYHRKENNDISFNVDSYYHQRKDNEKVFQMILSKSRTSENLTDSFTGLSYFHIACTGNDISKVEDFIENGVPLNSRLSGLGFSVNLGEENYFGYSALHFAIKYVRKKIVECLLSHGADININSGKTSGKTFGKTTPLHLACFHDSTMFNFINPKRDLEFDWSRNRADRLYIIELLLIHGASIHTKNEIGRTPFLINCWIPQNFISYRDSSYLHPEHELTYDDTLLKEISIIRELVAQLLLRYGAEIECQDYCGQSVLHYAAKFYMICPSGKNFAESLLNEHAELNVVDMYGNTPLHDAVTEAMRHEFDTSLIKLFLKYGANINAQNSELETPVHLAVRFYDRGKKCQAIIQTLLYNDEVDLNLPNNAGNTPLHNAVHFGKNYCVGGLLALGGDINLKNSEGKTPMDIVYSWLPEIEKDIVERSPRFFTNEITSILMVYVKLMTTAKRYISDEVITVYKSLIEHFPRLNECLDTDLNKEVEKLKSKKVDQFTSLFDILSKYPDDMVKHIKNKDFRVIALTTLSKSDFPLHQGMLEYRFRQGRMRCKYSIAAVKALKKFTKVEWPDSCVIHVLKNLSNNDLKALIVASKTGAVSCQ